MSSRETGQVNRETDAPAASARTFSEGRGTAERDRGSWAAADVAGRGDAAPDLGSTAPAGDAPSHADASWASSSKEGRQQRVEGARAEVDRVHRIADARAEVDSAAADPAVLRAEDSWASVAEAPAAAAERTAPSEGPTETTAPWPPDAIRDNDWDGLRQLERDGFRFSEHRMMWVDVDDPRLESSEHVRGERFKGGEATDGYKRDAAELYSRRDELTSLDDVDPRHTGDERIRIEEAEDGSLTITNGFHRIQAAREAGVPAVLADAVAFRGDPDG